MYPPCVMIVSGDGKNRSAAMAACAMLHLDPHFDSAARAVRAILGTRGRVLIDPAYRWQVVGYALRLGKLLPKDVSLEALLGKLSALVGNLTACW